MNHDLPLTIAQAAKAASIELANTDPFRLASVLESLAALIEGESAEILAANQLDIDAARGSGLPPAKLQRLALTQADIASLARSVRAVSALPAPQGVITSDTIAQPSGLRVQKVRMPLGVIAMIYEARPGVTVDAFSLCLRSGNACILKGGKEAAHSNAALMSLIERALVQHGLARASAQLVTTSDRVVIAELLACEGLIDLVIPRGGAELVSFVRQHSRIPVLAHDRGVCHIYVHAEADLDMAERICVSAKVAAPATCNAAECVLVDRAVAEQFLPRLCKALADQGVEIRGDAATCKAWPAATPACESDFGAEFLSLIIAVRVVDDLGEALAHIRQHSSNHTEAIITKSQAAQAEFAKRVHSSCVVINASTRNNDGASLGLGAEIGISTSRLHAYGPMGLCELTTQRFIVTGNGQIR